MNSLAVVFFFHANGSCKYPSRSARIYYLFIFYFSRMEQFLSHNRRSSRVHVVRMVKTGHLDILWCLRRWFLTERTRQRQVLSGHSSWTEHRYHAGRVRKNEEELGKCVNMSKQSVWSLQESVSGSLCHLLLLWILYTLHQCLHVGHRFDLMMLFVIKVSNCAQSGANSKDNLSKYNIKF